MNRLVLVLVILFLPLVAWATSDKQELVWNHLTNRGDVTGRELFEALEEQLPMGRSSLNWAR